MSSGAFPAQRRLARDRHGRGPRGPLARCAVPAKRSRAEQFADVLEAAIDHLVQRHGAELDGVDFVIEEVPPETPTGDELADASGVPLADVFLGGPRPTLVFYRQPIELRAGDPAMLDDFVHDVAIEAVAKLTGVDPDSLDPGYFE